MRRELNGSESNSAVFRAQSVESLLRASEDNGPNGLLSPRAGQSRLPMTSHPQTSRSVQVVTYSLSDGQVLVPSSAYRNKSENGSRNSPRRGSVQCQSSESPNSPLFKEDESSKEDPKPSTKQPEGSPSRPLERLEHRQGHLKRSQR